MIAMGMCCDRPDASDLAWQFENADTNTLAKKRLDVDVPESRHPSAFIFYRREHTRNQTGANLYDAFMRSRNNDRESK